MANRRPTLDDARARVIRAAEHIAKLEAELTAALPPRAITTTVAAPSFMGGGKKYISLAPLVVILIGETLYNLRGAMDYLVYELFQLDTGKIYDYTEFPIVDKLERWNKYFPAKNSPPNKPFDPNKRGEKWLHKLTGPHKKALKDLQPFQGCQWTKTLRNRSNIDKHRRLIVVESTVQSHGGMIGGIGPVTVTSRLISKVAFDDDKTLVVETLKDLHKEVSAVLDKFDLDFN